MGRSAFEVYADLEVIEGDGHVIAGDEAVRRALRGEAIAGLCRAGDLVFDFRLFPQVDESTGAARGAVGVTTDVTERHEARARLQQSERLAALGTLAAGTAHEINNPLTYMALSCEHALRELRSIAAAGNAPTAEQIQDLTACAARSVEGAMRVREIVRLLTLFACGGNAERRAPVDVRGVLESSIQLALHEIVFRARLVRNLTHVPPVLASETTLGQVFLSLLVNAAQSIPEGRAGDHEVRVSTMVDERGRIVVEVSDTGCGIDPAQLPRIFDPFFTLKSGGAATGLGLSISHGTVKALGGGDHRHKSTPGAGSTFRVSLPPADGAAFAIDERAEGVAPGDRRPQVLIVDDEPLVREALGRALGRDFNITLASSGSEAFAILVAKAGAPFDVVLCDLMMADLSGMDLYAEMLRNAPPRWAERFVFLGRAAPSPPRPAPSWRTSIALASRSPSTSRSFARSCCASAGTRDGSGSGRAVSGAHSRGWTIGRGGRLGRSRRRRVPLPFGDPRRRRERRVAHRGLRATGGSDGGARSRVAPGHVLHGSTSRPHGP